MLIYTLVSWCIVVGIKFIMLSTVQTLDEKKRKLEQMKALREAKTKERVKTTINKGFSTLTNDSKHLSPVEEKLGQSNKVHSYLNLDANQLLVHTNNIGYLVINPTVKETYQRAVETDQITIIDQNNSLTLYSAEDIDAIKEETRKITKEEEDLQLQKKMIELNKSNLINSIFPITSAISQSSNQSKDGLNNFEGKLLEDYIKQGLTVLANNNKILNISIDGVVGIEHGENTNSDKVVLNKMVFGTDITMESTVVAIAFKSSGDLFAVSYKANSTSGVDQSQKGCVILWSVEQNVPVSVFTAPEQVTTVAFSPFHSNLLLGGCNDGTLVQWDLRHSPRPKECTFPSIEGHQCCAIIYITVIGTQRHSELLSVDTQGRVALWDIEELKFPVESFEIGNSKTKQKSTLTCATMPTDATGTIYLSMANGMIATVNKKNSGASSICDPMYLNIAGDTVITSIETNPKCNDLFIASSLDGYCRIIYTEKDVEFQSKHVSHSITIEYFSDFVYCAKWSPTNPMVLAISDGSGNLTFWNILNSVSIPYYSAQIIKETDNNKNTPDAIHTLTWSPDGNAVACGTITGNVIMVSVPEELVQERKSFISQQTINEIFHIA